MTSFSVSGGRKPCLKNTQIASGFSRLYYKRFLSAGRTWNGQQSHFVKGEESIRGEGRGGAGCDGDN